MRYNSNDDLILHGEETSHGG
eukprot:COSAG03_NODE_21611_length_302_cov_0.743842_2_plen_20_part_01